MSGNEDMYEDYEYDEEEAKFMEFEYDYENSRKLRIANASDKTVLLWIAGFTICFVILGALACTGVL